MIINKQKDGTYKLSINPKNLNLGNNEIINKKDLYLYNRGKTIGFRKDKKLHKFVGLRDGYSRQLELSLKSININNNELISKRRVNFSSIEIDDDKVLHKFNNVNIINEVDSSNFKNIIKIDDYFKKIEIIYEVHTKGLRLINKLSGNNYVKDRNGQFIFISNKNNSKKFIINKPFVINDKYEYYDIIEDKLYIENGKLYYKKIVNNHIKKEDIKLPLYIDANIIFNLSNYGQLIKVGNILSGNYNLTTWNNILGGDADYINYLNDCNNYVNNGSSYSFNLHRIFLSFDTSNVDKDLIYKVELEVTTIDSDGEYVVQKSNFGDYLSLTDWTSYEGTSYGILDSSINNTFVVDLGQDGIDDINDNDVTQYVIRHKTHDYDGTLPTVGWESDIIHNWSFRLNIYVYDLIKERTYLNIPVNPDFGVINSNGSNWGDVKNGNNLNIIFNDINDEYGESVGVSYNGSNYQLNRTFIGFDTSFFQDYKSVISSVRLKLDNYMENNEGIYVYGSDYDDLSISDWNNLDTYYTGTTFINNGFFTDFDLPISSINTNGLTKFGLISYHDYNNIQLTNNLELFSGIDFENTFLEIIHEPIKVYGKSYYNVKEGDYFELKAYTNYGSSSNIMWYRDPEYINLVHIGNSFVDYSIEYEDNNKIYAIIILDDDFNPSTTISPQNNLTSVPLEITVNINSIDYPTIPEKYPNYNVIDIDSVYYKFNKCISGVCYTYIRDIDDIYEGFPLVSNNWGNNSYNLYNEFDIIDEFFSNTHEVEVAYNQNLDLTKRYNDLDGVILREGTRVLLMGQDDVTELGVYVAQYDNKLVKTDEMDTYDKVFRYKAHVNAGTYADQEIHIWPILPPPDDPFINCIPNPVNFIYNSGITQTVEIESNTSWSIYNMIPWVSINKSDGVGNDSIVLRTIKENNTGNARTGKIEFTGFGGVTTILTVNQDVDSGLEYRSTTDGNIRITTDNDNRIII